jgi:hypothetical protein
VIFREENPREEFQKLVGSGQPLTAVSGNHIFRAASVVARHVVEIICILAFAPVPECQRLQKEPINHTFSACPLFSPPLDGLLQFYSILSTLQS